MKTQRLPKLPLLKAAVLLLLSAVLNFSSTTLAQTSLPSGGTSILPANWLQTANPSGSAEHSIVNVSGMHFDRALRVETATYSKRTANFDTPIQVAPAPSPGDTVVVRFYYRGEAAEENTDTFVKSLYTMIRTPHSKDRTIELSDEWREFRLSFKIPEDQTGETLSKITLFFGKIPQITEIGGLEILRYDATDLAPTTFVPPEILGNSMICYQGKSKTIDAVWNDSHPNGVPIRISHVTTPQFGKATFTDSTVTYTSTKPHEFRDDYFTYTLTDDNGNSSYAKVKVLVVPDFLNGEWNIGHDFTHFPSPDRSNTGLLTESKRFIDGTTMHAGLSRFIDVIEKKIADGTLTVPVEEVCYSFAKRGPNGEDIQPYGVYWDIPHEVDSTFCLPIINSYGSSASYMDRMAHSHDLRSFRMKFTMTQRTINPSDLKSRWFIKTKWTEDNWSKNNENGDVGGGFIEKDEELDSAVIIDGDQYNCYEARKLITSEDVDGDGYPDRWWWGGGAGWRGKPTPPAGTPFPPDKHINGGRLNQIVDSKTDFSVDMDLKKVMDWMERAGWTGGGYLATLIMGSEMGSAGASKGKYKGAGVLMYSDAEYWVSLDREALTPIPDMMISPNGTPITIDLSPVFERLRTKGFDGLPPKLTYSVLSNSAPALVQAAINGDQAILRANGSTPGTAVITIQCSDEKFHWDDIETFEVTVADNTTDRYTLTVENGLGGGDYAAGMPVEINPAPTAGQTFNQWAGDIEYLLDPNAVPATVVMPTKSVRIWATYTGQTYPLTVTAGSGSGNHPVGQAVEIRADLPASNKLFDRWIGPDTNAIHDVTEPNTAIDMAARPMNIEATFHDARELTLINAQSSGLYKCGSDVPLLADPAPAGQVFDAWKCSKMNKIAKANEPWTLLSMPWGAFTVTATYKTATPGKQYLTVEYGTGSGEYAAGERLNIQAWPAPAGQVFDRWTGDTAGLADPASAQTRITMPNAPITITATYKDPRPQYTLTVENGSGSGQYAAGERILIRGDQAPLGQTLTQWTSTDPAALSSRTAADTTVTMPAKALTVTAAYSPTLPMVYLSDMPWSAAPAGTQTNLNYNQSPLTLDGISYEKGIGTLDGTTITYDLAGAYTRLQATVGIDDEQKNDPNANIQFRIEGDGTPLWQSAILQPGSTPEAIDLDIAGINTLELKTLKRGTSIQSRLGNWANAKLLNENQPPQRITNQAPIPNVQTITIEGSEPIEIRLQATDANLDPLRYILINPPTNGWLTGTAPRFIYTPPVGAQGVDFLTFRAYDQKAASPLGKIDIQYLFDDTDNDGLPDSWEQAHGLKLNGKDANQDADNDGSSNYEEFIAGTDPQNAVSFPAIDHFTRTTVDHGIIEWETRPGRVYNVQWADALTNSFEDLSNDLPYPTGAYTDTLHNTESAGFYQLHIKRSKPQTE